MSSSLEHRSQEYEYEITDFPFILVVCAACAPRGLPTREDSPTLIATQPPLTTAKPVSTSVPTSTTKPTLALPTPIPIFDVGIANLAISQQGQLYASGFGGDLQQLPQQQLAQWDGTKWIALATGFQPASNSLAVDNAGHLLIAVLEIL